MSQEKLRALLAEARREIATWHLGPRDPLVQRIDAALAEPVDADDIEADLRLHKEDRLRLRVENLRLERERDEARAEVERAYQRGAEAMREAAADAVKHLSHEDGIGMGSQRMENAIRALPVPEDKP